MSSNISIKKTVVLIIITAVSLITLGVAIFASTGEVRLNDSSIKLGNLTLNDEKFFSPEGIEKIDIRTVSEDVKFITSPQQEIKVAFYGNTSNKNTAPTLKVEKSGSTLKIKTDHNQKFFNIFGIRQRFRLDIHIPESYSEDMEINTVSADITMPELRLNNLYCKTVLGNLVLDYIESGELTFYTTSGDLKLDGSCNTFSFKSVSGDLTSNTLHTKHTEFYSTSGKMKVEDFIGDLDFRSISGDVYVVYSEFNNNIDIKTTSGDSKIWLPENSEFYISLKSTSGDIRTDFPVTVTKSSKKSLEGTVGSNKNKITGTSLSGDFNIAYR